MPTPEEQKADDVELRSLFHFNVFFFSFSVKGRVFSTSDSLNCQDGLNYCYSYIIINEYIYYYVPTFILFPVCTVEKLDFPGKSTLDTIFNTHFQ